MENNTFNNPFFPQEEPQQTEVLHSEIPPQPAEGMYTEVPPQPQGVYAGVQPVSPVYPQKKSFKDKLKAVPKKVWIIAGAAVVVIIAAIVIISMLSNTYKTPVKAMEDILNAKSLEDMIDELPALLNGFGESEAKKVLKILKSSEYYEDFMEGAERGFGATFFDSVEEQYGDNYKVKLKITEKEKLDEDECEDFEDDLHDVAELADELDDVDYEDLADDMGITRSKAKDLVKELKSLCKKCGKAKVSAGYELTVEVSIGGEDTNELTIRVFKADGRWILDVFSLVGDMGLDRYFYGGYYGYDYNYGYDYYY